MKKKAEVFDEVRNLPLVPADPGVGTVGAVPPVSAELGGSGDMCVPSGDG
jgi:hypothetical protein